jgi:hypothetical protein
MLSGSYNVCCNIVRGWKEPALTLKGARDFYCFKGYSSLVP